jgi:hypothetical protein
MTDGQGNVPWGSFCRLPAVRCGITHQRGYLLGLAAVCLPARYVTVLWRGAARIERRFARPATWTDIELEIASGLKTGPLDRTSLLGVLLAANSGATVALRYRTLIDVDQSEATAATLDRYREHSCPPRFQGQPGAKRLGVVPAHVHHRMITRLFVTRVTP